MFKWKNKSEIIRRKRRSDDKDELVITVADWKTSAVGNISASELIAFLWWWIPKLIEDLISNIDDEDGWKYMRIMLLSFIKSKVDDLLDNEDDDSDDDD